MVIRPPRKAITRLNIRWTVVCLSKMAWTWVYFMLFYHDKRPTPIKNTFRVCFAPSATAILHESSTSSRSPASITFALLVFSKFDGTPSRFWNDSNRWKLETIYKCCYVCVRRIKWPVMLFFNSYIHASAQYPPKNGLKKRIHTDIMARNAI